MRWLKKRRNKQRVDALVDAAGAKLSNEINAYRKNDSFGNIPEYVLESIRKDNLRSEALQHHMYVASCGCRLFSWGEPCFISLDCQDHILFDLTGETQKDLELEVFKDWSSKIKINLWVKGRRVGEWDEHNCDCAIKVLRWYIQERTQE